MNLYYLFADENPILKVWSELEGGTLATEGHSRLPDLNDNSCLPVTFKTTCYELHTDGQIGRLFPYILNE